VTYRCDGMFIAEGECGHVVVALGERETTRRDHCLAGVWCVVCGFIEPHHCVLALAGLHGGWSQ
jgi:hypothetical protein